MRAVLVIICQGIVIYRCITAGAGEGWRSQAGFRPLPLSVGGIIYVTSSRYLTRWARRHGANEYEKWMEQRLHFTPIAELQPQEGTHSRLPTINNSYGYAMRVPINDT